MTFSIPSAPILIPEGPWKEVEGCINAPKGFKSQGIFSGMRAKGPKADLALVVADEPAVSAGVFTTNVVCAAPVTYCRKVLSGSDTARAVLINAGQANAATGSQGDQNARASADAVAKALGINAGEVLIESTGVIGKQMKMEALLQGVPALADSLGADVESAQHAAVAITTTDLVSKSAAIEIQIGGKAVRVGGIAKGSGMIHPNMATMLGVVTCDAAVDVTLWRSLFKRAAVKSFNQITVDGDTSTNDTVIGLASGAAGNQIIKDASSPEAAQLEAAVTALLQGLAKSIAWDGEGATCLMEISCTGAADEAAANAVARSVAGSSLVKAAVFGHDPNWGRIACAAGYTGVPFDQNTMNISLGSHQLMRAGQPLDFDASAASSYLRDTCAEHGTVQIALEIGSGPGEGMAWGCDLSYQYVKINAEYTT